MSEIKINIKNLNTEIENLKSLKSRIISANNKCPTVTGGGKSIQEIENIGKAYNRMYSQLGTLVSNTILFMSNVGDSYMSSDNKASSSFK